MSVEKYLKIQQTQNKKHIFKFKKRDNVPNLQSAIYTLFKPRYQRERERAREGDRERDRERERERDRERDSSGHLYSPIYEEYKYIYIYMYPSLLSP